MASPTLERQQLERNIKGKRVLISYNCDDVYIKRGSNTPVGNNNVTISERLPHTVASW